MACKACKIVAAVLARVQLSSYGMGTVMQDIYIYDAPWRHFYVCCIPTVQCKRLIKGCFYSLQCNVFCLKGLPYKHKSDLCHRCKLECEDDSGDGTGGSDGSNGSGNGPVVPPPCDEETCELCNPKKMDKFDKIDSRFGKFKDGRATYSRSV